MSVIINLTAFFSDDGVPATGLSATIRVRRIDTGALVVTDAAMTELGDGHYNFDFTSTYDDSIADYAIRADGSASLGDDDRFSFGTLDETGFRVDQVRDATVAADVLVIAGSSTTEVRTDAAQADGFYDDLVLVVINSAGVVARQISGYLNTNGAFTVTPALPFTPSTSDRAIVLGRTASSAIDVAAISAAVWAESLPGAFGAGTAGFILGTNLNALITSRSSHSAVDVRTEMDTNSVDLDAIQAQNVAIGVQNVAILAAIAALNNLSIADVQTALTGQGYTVARAGNLDNLDVAISVVDGKIDTLDANVDDLVAALIEGSFTAAAGSTTTEIRTNATQADDFYDGAVVVVVNAAGTAARIVEGYANVNGAFTVDTLPFTPAASDPVHVLSADVLRTFSAVEKIRKTTTNRVVVNLTDTQVDVYEDDGTTIAFSFTISGDRRTRTPI
jgi:hypothetical protein